MKIAMSERRILVKNHAREYQGARKREKGRILDLFVGATGYKRGYAARLLRSHGRQIQVRPGVVARVDAGLKEKRGRGREYGAEVVEALKRMWECLDYMCGKRLRGAIPVALESLERHGELEVSAEVRRKLLKISGATIDRLLRRERERIALKHRGGTKPGTLLKSQIPVRTFAEWDECQVGFVEIDLVGHDGGSSQGEYAQTLDVTDVHTGWSEQRAVLCKAQRWVFEALREVRARLPFPLLGIDSDNGGEFINQALLTYCREEKITFTRARAERKNDTCYVEQKNYSIVRRGVGYGRYVGSAAVAELNRLYGLLRLRTNFFLPSMKLIEKRRCGSRVHKRYDEPRTPCRRILESESVSEAVKRGLRRQLRGLNLMELDRAIRESQSRLEKHVRPVRMGRPPDQRSVPAEDAEARQLEGAQNEFFEGWANARVCPPKNGKAGKHLPPFKRHTVAPAPDYPLAGCSPAEPTSVSSGKRNSNRDSSKTP